MSMDGRMPLMHEQLIAVFLQYPHLVDEYRTHLSTQLFRDDAVIMKTMMDIEGEWNWRDIHSLVPDEHKDKVPQLARTFASAHTAEKLIDRVKSDYLDHRMTEISHKLADAFIPPQERLQMLRQELDAISDTYYERSKDHKQRVRDWFENLKRIKGKPELAMGMRTGWDRFDSLTFGLRKKDFIVIGGYTSHGKSAFETELALRLTERGSNGAVFSLEMSTEQFSTRMASNLTQIDQDAFRTGNLSDYQIEAIAKYLPTIEKIHIDDNRGVDCEYIENEVRRLKREQNLDFVMVDYLQDTKEDSERNDTAGSALARICRKLRKIAQKFDVCLIGLSQVRREVAQGDYQLPKPSDLSGSTGIETSADMIIMIGREEQSKPDTDRRGIMDVNIAKNRNGRCGQFELKCNMARNMIYNKD